MNATYPPVKVLLTDGLNQGFIRPVEQVQLIYSFSFILLHHLLFLPEYKICYFTDMKSIIFPLDWTVLACFSPNFFFSSFTTERPSRERGSGSFGFGVRCCWAWCVWTMSQCCYTPLLIWRAEWAKIKCTKTVLEWKPGALGTEISAKKVPCIHNLEGQSCPSERGRSQQWNSRCSAMTRCNKDTSCDDSLCKFTFWRVIHRQWSEITSSALTPPRQLTQNEASVGSLSWFCTLHSADTSGFLVHL